MSKGQWLISVGAMLGGVIIIFISLLSTRSVLDVSRHPMSQRQLYFSRNLLPDHLFYPVLAAADRIRLQTAPPVEKIELQLNFGRERLEDAQDLVLKSEPDLALETVIKSQKYMLNAVNDSVEAEISSSYKQIVMISLVAYYHNLDNLKTQFNDNQRDVIDQLLSECEAAKLRLEESLL